MDISEKYNLDMYKATALDPKEGESKRYIELVDSLQVLQHLIQIDFAWQWNNTTIELYSRRTTIDHPNLMRTRYLHFEFALITSFCSERTRKNGTEYNKKWIEHEIVRQTRDHAQFHTIYFHMEICNEISKQ